MGTIFVEVEENSSQRPTRCVHNTCSSICTLLTERRETKAERKYFQRRMRIVPNKRMPWTELLDVQVYKEPKTELRIPLNKILESARKIT